VARRLRPAGEGHTILIFDPETLAECPPDRIGEIWLSGESVARGYWEPREEHRGVGSTRGSRTVAAVPSDRRFRLHGPRGAVRHGPAQGHARRAGKKLLPPRHRARGGGLPPRSAAELQRAFTVEIDERDRLVLVHEVEAGRTIDHERWCWRSAPRVAAAVDLPSAHIVLINARSLPKNIEREGAAVALPIALLKARARHRVRVELAGAPVQATEA